MVVVSDTPLSVAARIAERIRASVQSSPFKIGPPAGLLSVTVSIGLAERGPGANPDALMRRADKALYRFQGRRSQPRDRLGRLTDETPAQRRGRSAALQADSGAFPGETGWGLAPRPPKLRELTNKRQKNGEFRAFFGVI